MQGKIKTIAHLSDIHIRKLHRLVEYREVFKRLYKKLREVNPDLIYVGGDVVHGKLDTSPEETRLVASFFLKLTNITDVVLIIGNHDVNLQNKGREDALSPIIDLVKKINPNIHYWKKSGKYTIRNIDFGVMSIFDTDKNGNQLTDKLPDPTHFDNEYKIALYHGPVDTIEVDSGFKMTTKHVTSRTFNGYDCVLLGDIHKRQQISTYNKDAETPAAHYCGSLIQQGFAEIPSKGFLLWDIEKRKPQFIQIENDYGFKTVEVIDGKIQNTMKFIPPKGNIRIKHWDTTLEQIRDIQIALRKQYPKLKEIKPEKQDTLSAIDKGDRVNKIGIGDVRNTEYQNELICDFLKRNVEGIDESTIDRVCSINKVTNNTPEISNEGIARNVSWKLKSFEFDNMFSYKEGNKIDFGKMHGTVGLVAPNHSGKSAMLDSVAYTIFDTCSRAYKAIDVMNKRKQKFKAKLNIEINGEDYWIERTGILKSRKNRKTGDITYTCPVDVKFYIMRGDEKINLSGQARRRTQYGSGTNDEIRELLGTFDDFILTSLSLQNNSSNFIDKRQSERKQILSQFMDIDIFDQLYDIAKVDSNDERLLLKQFQKRDSYALLAVAERQFKHHKENEQELSRTTQTLSEKINDLKDKKLKLVKKIWKSVDINYNLSTLEEQLNMHVEKKDNLEKKLQSESEYKETLRPLYLKYYEKIDHLDEDKIKTNYDTYQELMYKMNDFNAQIKITESEIKSNEDILINLNEYKYNPDCSFCVGNASEHINHQQLIQANVDRLIKSENKLLDKKEFISRQLDELAGATNAKEEHDRFTEELNQISQDAIKIGGKISTAEEQVKSLHRDIEMINEKIKKYYEYEQKIKQNYMINEKIEEVTIQINLFESKLKSLMEKHKISLSDVAIARVEKERIEQDIQKLIEIEQKILDYDLYLMSMSKDGIPYELITKAIPSIQAEINEVLDAMMVGFTINLEMEGTNVNTYICYGEDSWSLELASGMEKFVSSLAIRVGLINVSTLPRPNFLCLDEGFGSLDGENIANMESAFNYLKTQFDFVLIITHLDAIKDYMNHLISIDIDNGYSKIIFA